MKKNDYFIVVTFVGIITLIFLFVPLKHLSIMFGYSKLTIDGNWKSNIQEKGNAINRINIKLENIKINLENRVNNYFPLYDELNSLYHSSNRYLNSLIYKDYFPVGINTDREYVVKKNDSYFINTSLKSNEIKSRVISHAGLYNKMNEIVPTYIYLPHRWEFQDKISNKSYQNMYEYIEMFKKNLNKNIKVGELKVDSIKEYNNIFFKTDHHWTCEGASQGYMEIMNLLDVNIYNKDFKCVKIDNKFRGSLANRFKDKKVYDEFSYIDSNLKYEVLINDKVNLKYKPKKANANNMFFDYYVGFYYGFFGKVVYDFKNDKENLLILADSYSWAIDDLIASNFNKTHVINLMFDEYKNGKFDFKNYVKENNITKVLILQETPTTVYDVFNHGLIEKVVR